ncbi:MAG: AIM24 family protein [Actinomycetota bacterium]|nr:AIM24 family protein [Actinomycetota bacterium]
MRSELEIYRPLDVAEPFALVNSRLLRVSLSDHTITAKLGSMVLYRGAIRFTRAKAGMRRLLKGAATSETTKLMTVTGVGEAFLADRAQNIHLVYLEDERLTCNSPNLLAFESGIGWDIRKVTGGLASILAGGIFNTSLEGTGWVALLSEGPPIMVDVATAPTACDPKAAIAWSSGVETRVNVDFQLKTLIGLGSGETVQLATSGHGWLLVQPSEGPGKSSGGGGGGGVGDLPLDIAGG